MAIKLPKSPVIKKLLRLALRGVGMLLINISKREPKNKEIKKPG